MSKYQDTHLTVVGVVLAIILIVTLTLTILVTDHTGLRYWVSFVLSLNLMAFLTCFIDKKLAEGGRFRAPNAIFIILSLLGGVVAVFVGLLLFRHKISGFTIFVVALILVLYMSLVVLAIHYGIIDLSHWKTMILIA